MISVELVRGRNRLLAPKVMKALNVRGYETVYCENKEEAAKSVLALIPQGASVTWGGSVTLDEIGVKEQLKSGEYQVIDRDTAKSPEERMDMMRQAFTTDVYLSSVNAMTEDGELLNIDAVGNRVAAIAFGPKKVILIVGMNKICADMDSARKRARTYTAPANSLRLGIEAPCTKIGTCANCQSPSSICSYFVEMRRSKVPGRITVVLVNEDLGL